MRDDVFVVPVPKCSEETSPTRRESHPTPFLFVYCFVGRSGDPDIGLRALLGALGVVEVAGAADPPVSGHEVTSPACCRHGSGGGSTQGEGAPGGGTRSRGGGRSSGTGIGTARRVGCRRWGWSRYVYLNTRNQRHPTPRPWTGSRLTGEGRIPVFESVSDGGRLLSVDQETGSEFLTGPEDSTRGGYRRRRRGDSCFPLDPRGTLVTECLHRYGYRRPVPHRRRGSLEVGRGPDIRRVGGLCPRQSRPSCTGVSVGDGRGKFGTLVSSL